jgi:chorismate mutase
MAFQLLLLLAIPILTTATTYANPSTCHFMPSLNATPTNYPSSPSIPSNTTFPYNLTLLSTVPIATICTTPSPRNYTAELACARTHIDAIDEQLSFLYARRLGYAAVAGDAKFAMGTPLNDPTRNEAVAEGVARRVARYGGSEAAGRVLGGEGCMIFASLSYEVEKIGEDCGGHVTEKVERVCGVE